MATPHGACRPARQRRGLLDSVCKGESVREVLEYVQFDGKELVDRLQMAVELAVRENRITHEDAGRIMKFYEESLQGYTYLEGPVD
ncbi:MAG: hypothetical protein R3B90_06495 [Planctomycetaceae bacterium]